MPRLSSFIQACVLASTVLAADQPVAMVLDLKGPAQLEVNGKREPLALLGELPKASPIHLAAGSRLVLVSMVSGDESLLLGPATFHLDARGLPTGAPARTRPVGSLRREVHLKPGGLAQASVAMRSIGGMQLMEPRSPGLLESRPIFRWRAPKQPCRFLLKGAEGHVLIDLETTANQAELPPGVQLPEGLPCTWELRSGSQRLSGELRLLDAGQREALASARAEAANEFSSRVLLALLLEAFRLKEEAAETWKRLALERPEDPVLQAFAARPRR